MYTYVDLAGPMLCTYCKNSLFSRRGAWWWWWVRGGGLGERTTRIPPVPFCTSQLLIDQDPDKPNVLIVANGELYMNCLYEFRNCTTSVNKMYSLIRSCFKINFKILYVFVQGKDGDKTVISNDPSHPPGSNPDPFFNHGWAMQPNVFTPDFNQQYMADYSRPAEKGQTLGPGFVPPNAVPPNEVTEVDSFVCVPDKVGELLRVNVTVRGFSTGLIRDCAVSYQILHFKKMSLKNILRNK